MNFILKKAELEKMKLLNPDANLHFGGDIFIENDETLIKALHENILQKLLFLRNIPEHDHVIKPIEIGYIVSDHICFDEDYKSAYRIKFLKNAKTLISLYRNNISYEEKLKYGTQLFSALQFLHQYFVIGDIHSKNILVNDGEAYLADLDFSRGLGCRFSPIYCSYYLTFLRAYENTKSTDITKLYIEMLSFILEINFTIFISMYGYREFYKVISSYNLPNEIKSFLKLGPNKLRKLGDEAYNFEQFMTPDILELKRSLNILDYSNIKK